MLLVLRKAALLAALVAIGVAYLGWMSKERARRFVRFMLAFYVLGFVWRVGSWYLSP